MSLCRAVRIARSSKNELLIAAKYLLRAERLAEDTTGQQETQRQQRNNRSAGTLQPRGAVTVQS